MDTTLTLFLYSVTTEEGSSPSAAGVIRSVAADMAEVLRQLEARFPEAGKIQVRKISAQALAI